jgi:hypothetical protein
LQRLAGVAGSAAAIALTSFLVPAVALALAAFAGLVALATVGLAAIITRAALGFFTFVLSWHDSASLFARYLA